MPSQCLVHCGKNMLIILSKDRVTLLGFVIAAGTCKIPLAFIHTSSKPHCFKHGHDCASCSVLLTKKKKACMTAKIFEDWFQNFYVPHVMKFCHVNGVEYEKLLLLDSIPQHCLRSSDGKLTTLFFPANTTFEVQPMDQGILEGLKRNHTRNVFCDI